MLDMIKIDDYTEIMNDALYNVSLCSLRDYNQV
jgi:hypothetical protein